MVKHRRVRCHVEGLCARVVLGLEEYKVESLTGLVFLLFEKVPSLGFHV